MRTMLKTLLAASALAFTLSATAQQINGAGATFPAPVYIKWSELYEKASGVKVNYQGIGSSGGVKQIQAKTVVFAGTDAPRKGDELEKDGLVQFPAIIGGTVPVFNLEGFKPGELKISGDLLADIFLGNIKNWNDKKLAALNPGKKLPDQAITVVHRADGSGTTFNFTDYLATVSKAWNEGPGKGATVKWPAETSIGAKGNDGVANQVKRTKGAVGYIEYAYVKKADLPYFALKNKAGKFAEPDDKTFAAAAAGANWFGTPGMGVSIVDQPGATTWPISTASFILVYKNPEDKKATAEALKFFEWAFKNGKEAATELEYVPLPDALAKQIRDKVFTTVVTK